jgi:hypothetical protein
MALIIPVYAAQQKGEVRVILGDLQKVTWGHLAKNYHF